MSLSGSARGIRFVAAPRLSRLTHATCPGPSHTRYVPQVLSLVIAPPHALSLYYHSLDPNQVTAALTTLRPHPSPHPALFAALSPCLYNHTDTYMESAITPHSHKVRSQLSAHVSVT